MGVILTSVFLLRRVLVTANPAFQAKELVKALEQSGASALFLAKKFRGNPMAQIGSEVAALASRIASVTINQLAMQKLAINQAIEASGLMSTQRLATIFDGVSRHSPEGMMFKKRVEEVG